MKPHTPAPSDPRAVAAQLSAALESADPHLLRPLLHPEARWGGEEDTPQTCHNRSDVLAWYGRLHRAGVRARVDEVLLREGAVVLGLALSGPDEGPDGPRPAHLFQVFRLRGGLVADIRGYPDRDEALTVAENPLPQES